MSATALRRIEFQALAALWEHKRLWLLHVAGNAILLVLLYAWLWIPEGRVWHLLFSALLLLLVIAGALWLHGGTLAFFRRLHEGRADRSWPVFRATVRRLPALALWVACLYLALRVIEWVGGYGYEASRWVASWLTMVLRSPITPSSIAKIVGAIVWLITWFVVPVTFLPVALRASTQGFTAFRFGRVRKTREVLGRPSYWIAYAVLFLICAYVPYRVVTWVPKVRGLRLEATSLGMRLLLAYLLMATGWLALLSALGRLGSTTRAGE